MRLTEGTHFQRITYRKGSIDHNEGTYCADVFDGTCEVLVIADPEVTMADLIRHGNLEREQRIAAKRESKGLVSRRKGA